MILTENYMLTHDIDWFFIINRKPVHLASNGSLLPFAIDKQELRFWQHRVAEHPNIYNAEHIRYCDENLAIIASQNQENISRGEGEEFHDIEFDREHYIASFAIFAQKGLGSYDWNEQLHRYLLIAAPSEGYDNFPKEYSFEERKGRE